MWIRILFPLAKTITIETKINDTFTSSKVQFLTIFWTLGIDCETTMNFRQKAHSVCCQILPLKSIRMWFIFPSVFNYFYTVIIYLSNPTLWSFVCLFFNLYFFSALICGIFLQSNFAIIFSFKFIRFFV